MRYRLPGRAAKGTDMPFSLAAGLFLRRFAKQSVQSRLVVFSLAPEPSHHVGVQPHRELLLGSAAKGIADGVFPEFFRARRNLSIRASGSVATRASRRWRAEVRMTVPHAGAISGARLIRVSVKKSASSVLRVENSETIAPFGPAWNQCSVSGASVYCSPGFRQTSCWTV